MRAPPLGVVPGWLWREQHPEPTKADLRSRATALEEAIVRYRAAGRVEHTEWLAELGALRQEHHLPA